MAFYSDFARYYESVFPYKQPIFNFLKSYLPRDARDVLDIGCAVGHYADKFTKEGFSSVGIDLDPAMIEWAKSRYYGTTFKILDMLHIEQLGREFDFVFCIGNTAAHLSHRQFERFLRAVYHVLRPGGTWVFQVRNWDYVTKQIQYTFPVLEAEERLKFFRTYSNINSNSLQFNTRLVAGDDLIFEQSVEMYPMSTAHYIDVLERQKFQVIDFFGDFQKKPLNADVDSAAVFVLEKSVISA